MGSKCVCMWFLGPPSRAIARGAERLGARRQLRPTTAAHTGWGVVPQSVAALVYKEFGFESIQRTPGLGSQLWKVRVKTPCEILQFVYCTYLFGNDEKISARLHRKTENVPVALVHVGPSYRPRCHRLRPQRVSLTCHPV